MFLPRSLYLFLLLAILGSGVGYWISIPSPTDAFRQELVQKFEQTLQQKEEQAAALLEEAGRQLKDVPPKAFFTTPLPSISRGTNLFLYRNDTLRYWSDNSIPVDRMLDLSSFHSHVMALNNGWYRIVEQQQGKYRLYALILLKQTYPYHNQYLSDHFGPGFDLPAGANITQEVDEQSLPVRSRNGDTYFRLSLPPPVLEKARSDLGPVVLVTIGFLSFLIFLYLIFPTLCKQAGFGMATLITGLILFTGRYLTIGSGFFGITPNPRLFDPSLYASTDLFPTLGDLILNTIVLVFFILLLRKGLQQMRKPEPGPSPENLFTFLGWSILTLLYGLLVTFLFRSLLQDSNISFNVNDLFALSWYSLASLLVMGALFLSFTLLGDRWARLSHQLGLSPQTFLPICLALAGGHIILAHWLGFPDLALVLWPLVILIILWQASHREKGYGYGVYVLLISLYAILGAHTFSRFTEKKEHQSRQVIAENLALDEDPVTDLLFREVEQEMLNDPQLQRVFRNPGTSSPAMVQKKLEQTYFTGYWDQYRITPYLFGKDSSDLLSQDPGPSRDFSRLDQMIRERSEKTPLSDNLHYVRDPREKVGHIAKFQYCGTDPEDTEGFLFLEFATKQIPREIGFPRLLLDQGTSREEALLEYAYARYVEGELVDRAGEYPFPTTITPFLPEQDHQEPVFLDRNGYNHLIYPVGQGSVIILSHPEEDLVASVTTFSYLFLLFSLLFLATRSLYRLPDLYQQPLSLKGKVRAIIMGLVVVSMILFGYATQYSLRQQYQQQNQGLISEKAHSVLIELQQKLSDQEQLNEELDEYLQYILSKFSNVFFTDINLYDKEGSLIATSRPQVFQKGLLSRQMHPQAFAPIVMEQQSEFIHEETIGQMHYLSAYIPFRNEDGEILAYLNLPYFAKQSELEKELSGFFVAMINILVVLFALSVVAALFVSNWVTRPLRLLQESLAGIELGRSNRQLEYEGSDEIAELVAEYNRKVAELQDKAEQLARSERESAWREMAKQVAHEIKNPLTPMKLRLQQLQKERAEQTPDPEKVRQLSDHLIDQIDTLARIAGEFSNFAQMPKAREEYVDLDKILSAVKDLYEEAPGATLHFRSEVTGQTGVVADKEQLYRVFSNLVNNALQAIPGDREGNVMIELKETPEDYVVEVRDNGKGIPNEVQEKIFQPNFTTRSRGTGLGLAIVRNIVEMSGGRVWFESEAGQGTCFYVALPKAQ